MPRTMLQVRMQALARHLEEAQDPSNWKENLDLQNVVVDEDLWMIAIERIREEATAQHDAIKALITEVSADSHGDEQAWRLYTKIQADSEQIFRECLELLGGLALRDRINEEHLCKFADGLIKELSSAVGRMSRFTIPVLDESLSSTLRRVATVRFPEWHMWTLPLVAYEYAEALIEENYAKLRELASQLANEAAVSVSPTKFSADAKPERSQAASEQDNLCGHLERKFHVLLADALATYTTGPAYACSALVLRLNPLASGDDSRPSDEERAAMILGVLRAMGWQARPSFDEVAERLGNYWQESVATVRRSAPDRGEGAVLRAPLDLDRVMPRLHHAFFRPKMAFSADDWLTAQTWSMGWIQQIKAQKKDLSEPSGVGPEHRLRDALNACWHCRIETTAELEPTELEAAEDLVEKIARVGRRLCMTIMEQPPLRAGGVPGSAPQPER
jgi:hypothetical protein